MANTDTLSCIRDRLLHLGYNEASTEAILQELDTLFKEIDFKKFKEAADSALEAKDTKGFISSIKDLMISLEDMGYYRPDFPTRLIRYLVNGLNLGKEDIFAILDRADISEGEKSKEKEFQASCAAITQLGYILLSRLVSEVKAASSGPHVFIIVNVTPCSTIFIDFSIDSIREINVDYAYSRKEDYYYLKNPVPGLDKETSGLLTEYYSFFHVTSGIGLSHNIHNNLGIAYDRVGMYEEAIEEFNEAIRLDSGYIEAHNNLAVTYNKVGMFEEALNELKRAISLKPEFAEAHSNIGSIYADLGRYEEAIEELEVALRLGYTGAHNNLGNVYTLQKRNEEAIKEFREALRLAPDHALAHSNLGSMYAESGRYEEALMEFQEATRLEPESPEAYYGLGLAYYNLGSYEKAIRAMIRAACLNQELLDSVPEKISLKVRQGISRLKGRE